MTPSSFHVGDDDKYAKFANAQRAHPEPLKVTPSPCHIPDSDDEDKYNKSHKHISEPLKKYHSAIGVFTSILENVPLDTVFFFMCFVLASGAFFKLLLGVTFDVSMIERFTALQLEILGLVMLRRKIRLRKSVSGVSGMTFVMYAATYGVRIGLSTPSNWSFEWKDLDPDATLGCVSFLLVLDVLRSVFWTHRSTYQEDLDVFKAWYLIPGCWTMGLLLRPHFSGLSWFYGYCWCSCLYMDVLALMPQVVMMSRSGGKVEAPIANFVAATSVSRCGDLLHSLVYLGEMREQEPFSYWFVVLWQMMHLLLVADFMYYFLKARASASGILDSISLSDESC